VDEKKTEKGGNETEVAYWVHQYYNKLVNSTVFFSVAREVARNLKDLISLYKKTWQISKFYPFSNNKIFLVRHNGSSPPNFTNLIFAS
jgi:hypothetical protein